MQLGSRRFEFDHEVAVMAVVNRTPDSFYDRGATFGLDAAVARAEAHLLAGADIVDVGGVKAGPGAAVTADEELDRVVPFVERFREVSDAPLSVDTYRPAVAAAAVDAGADLVNDVTGLRHPEIADVVAARSATGLVVTHHGGGARTRPFRPDYDPDVVTVARARCAELADQAMRRGVGRDQIMVDPGHDMFKTTAHSLALTRRIGTFADLGFPVLVALSNKDFVGEALDLPLDDRGPASLAAALYCVLHGARIVRVHDAWSTVQAVRMLEVVLGWRQPARAVRGLD